MNICPNLKNKQVKLEFDDLVRLFGEDAAYFLWDANKGYGLESAPNGEHSLLYDSLLQHYEGDRDAALVAKAKVYTSEFREWFGDWLTDENSEPKVKFYGPTMGKTTAAEFNENLVDFDDIVRQDIKNLAEKLGKSVKLLKTESGEEYVNLLKTAVEKWKNNPKNNGKTLVVSNAALAKEIEFDNDIQIPSKEVFIKRQVLRSEENKSKKLLEEEASAYYDDLINKWYSNPVIENRYVSDLESVSKIVDENGEPKMVYHGSNFDFSTFITKHAVERKREKIDKNLNEEEEALKLFTKAEQDIITNYNPNDDIIEITGGPFDDIFTNKNPNEELLSRYWEEVYKIKEKNTKYTEKNNIGSFFSSDIKYAKSYGHNTYGVFLNIKTPAYKKNLHRIYTFEDNIFKLQNEGYDGIYGKDVKGRDVESNGIEYVVFDPNQIKSVDNEGLYSKTDDNIYHNIINRNIKTVEDLKKAFTEIATTYFDFHNYNYIRFTKDAKKSIQEHQDQLDWISTAFGFPSGTIKITDYGKVYFNDRLLNNHFNVFLDTIEDKQKIKNMILIEKLAKSIAKKFNYPIKIQFVRNTNYNAKFENGVIKINANKVNSNIVFEEFLHPFVEALYQENRTLFNNLWKEATKQFPKLRAQIALSYKNDKFAKEDRYKELVTQALSRYYADIYEKDQKGELKQKDSIFKQAIDWIIKKFNLNRLFELNKNVTLEQLANALYNADNINIDQKYYNIEAFNQNSVIEESNWEDDLYSEIQQHSEIKEALSNECNVYINEKMSELDTSTMSEEDITKAELEFEKQFFVQKVDKHAHAAVSQLSNYFSKNKDSKVQSARQKLIENLEDAVISRNTDKIKTVLSVAYTSIMNINPAHMSRQLIQDYILTFADSEEMQDAFRVFDGGKGQSVEQLTKEIIDSINSPISDSNKIKRLNTFIKALTNLAKAVFFPITISSYVYKKIKNKDEEVATFKEKQQVLRDLTKFFVSNEQLGLNHSKQVVFDVSNWTIKGNKIVVSERDVIQSIIRGVNSRILSLTKSTTPGSAEEVERLLEWLNSLNTIGDRAAQQVQQKIERGIIEEEDYDTEYNKDLNELRQEEIAKFLSNGIEEIRNLALLLRNIKNEDYNFNKFSTLMRMNSDIIGFYDNITKRYIRKFSLDTNNEAFHEGGDQFNALKLIRSAVISIQDVFEDQLQRYTDSFIDQVADEYIDVGNKDLFKINAKLWLRNKIDNGNLSALEKLAGAGYTSTSPIVRILDMYIREANMSVRQDAIERGKELLKAYDKCEGIIDKILWKNFMMKFVEKDEKGNPTGYFASPIKYGVFEYKMRQARKKLNKQYNVQFDKESGVYIFESDESRLAYEDALDDIRYKLGEIRKYTPDYYKARRRILSKDTLDRLNYLNTEIEKLEKKCIESVLIDGKPVNIPLMSKLSPFDKQKLDQLYKERKSLSSIYDIVYDASGNVLQVKEKPEGSLARKIANELQAWNIYKNDRIKYMPDRERFDKVREKLVEKYGEGSVEVSTFDYRYSTRRASDEWYAKLASESSAKSEHLKLLLEQRKSILNAIELKSGLYNNRYDFSKLSAQALLVLRDIEQEISNAREHGVHSEDYVKFIQQKTKSIPINKVGTDIPFLEAEKRKIESLYPGDSNAMMEHFFNKYFIVDQKGNYVPMTVFYLFSPAYQEDIDENVPIGLFNVAQPSLSNLMDSRYDSNFEGPMLIERRKEYINEDYEEILKDKNMKDFYDKLMKVMDDAWSMLPQCYRYNRYQMPQRRDRSSHLLFGRNLSIKSVLSNMFTVNENDIQFNEEFTTRPDGTMIETIPIRWVKKLSDPSGISTDVLGSVMEFYEMAQNFREKQVIAAVGEALKLQVSRTSNGHLENDQSSRIGTMLSMFVYGRLVSGFGNKSKLSRLEGSIAKMLKALKNLTHSKLMKHNLIGIGKNLIDSSSSMYAEIHGGKYFNNENFKNGVKHMASELIRGKAFSAGKTLTNSWTAKAMQYNGVSGSIRDMFGKRNETRVRRLLSMVGDFEYDFIDYSFKGLTTNMIYDTYHLVTNPSTGKKEFMNREQVIYAFYQKGYSKQSAIDAYNNSTITLRDAYDSTGTEFKIKDEYLDIIRPMNESLGRRSRKLELRIASTIQERSGIINGVLNDIDKNKLNLNYIGALVMQMRGWMIAQQSDYSKYGHDFAIYSDDIKQFISNRDNRNIQYRGLLRAEKNNLDLKDPQILEEFEGIRGMFNFATGTVENGAWRNLMSSYMHYAKNIMKNKNSFDNNLTDNERYIVRRMNASIMSVVILSALSFVFGTMIEQDGDDPDWWKLVLYAMTVNSISERTSQLGYAFFSVNILDLVSSLMVSKSILDSVDAPVTATYDMMTLAQALFFGIPASSLDPLKNGAYSDLPFFIKGNKEIENAIGAKDGKTPKYVKSLLEASSVVPGISELGLANIYKNSSESGVKSKEHYYYESIFPTKQFAYQAQWTKNVKDQNGVWWAMEHTGAANAIREQVGAKLIEMPIGASKKSNNNSSSSSNSRNTRRNIRRPSRRNSR